jgi:hypothetical protein
MPIETPSQCLKSLYILNFSTLFLSPFWRCHGRASSQDQVSDESRSFSPLQPTLLLSA